MKAFLFSMVIVFFGSSVAFASYDTLSISSGYNADVIANGTGTGYATTTNDVDGANYAYVANGWKLNSSSSACTTGLPSNRILSSSITSGLDYKLADYSNNNSLRLTNGNNGSLTLQTATSAQTLYILAVSGSGSSTMTVTIHFTDNTTQTQTSMLVADWYGGSSVAYTGFQRIYLVDNTLNSSYNGPNFYQYSISISAANQSKQISSVNFNHTSGTGVLNVFALSIEASAVTCPQPTNLTDSNVTDSSASLGWTEAGSATSWQISYAPNGGSAASGTHIVTSSNPDTIDGLNAATGYVFYVRAICSSGDTSLWSGPEAFSTGCGVIPAITSVVDSSRCGPGSVTLKAHAGSGVVRWYLTATGGTPIDTGTSFTTPFLSTTKTYYVAAAPFYASVCETTTRQPVVATINNNPVINLGADTVLCQGTSILLNAATPNSTYHWNTGAHTSSISATIAGTYWVKVTDNHGCIGRDTIVLTAAANPVNNLPNISNLCTGSTITLDAGNAGCTFNWSTTATTQSIQVSTPGTYTVAITTSEGCSINSSTQVIQRALPVVNLGNDTAICHQYHITLDAQNPGSQYLWNTSATSQTIQTTDSGDYSVKVTNIYGCYSSDTIHLAFLSLPHADGFNFIPQFYENLGEVSFSIINPFDVQSCKWDFGDGSAASTDFNPTHVFPVNGGTFLVSLTVLNACGEYSTALPLEINTQTGIVSIANGQPEISLYPNPANDRITLQLSQPADVQQIAVYNVGGRMVHQQDKLIRKNTAKLVISTRDLPAGVYLMRILTDKGWQGKKFEVLR